jgi:hypothetical protein
VYKPTESLEIEAAASCERMCEVIKENGCLGWRKIHLFNPTVFTAYLPLDKPSVMQKPAAFHECVKMEALSHPLECGFPIGVGRLLFL